MNDLEPPSTGARPRNIAQHSDEQIQQIAIELARLMADSRLEDVVLLDVRKINNITDYILIGTGSSERQTQSVASEVETAAKASGLVRLGTDTDRATSWVVVDLCDIIVHLFEANARATYDLEMLWGDATRIDWKR